MKPISIIQNKDRRDKTMMFASKENLTAAQYEK